MKQIKGVVDYLQTFFQGRISFEYLISVIQGVDLHLILVITKAAGREGGINIDVYCVKKYLTPFNICKKEYIYCEEGFLDCVEEVYSFWRNPLTIDELISEEEIYSFWRNPFSLEEISLIIREPLKMESVVILDCENINSQEALRQIVGENLFVS